MRGNRSRDTKPELALRRLVDAAGLRYRVAAKPLPGMRRTADMVFRPVRVAVFVDGCFWHGCPDHFVPPKTNPGYWEDKIAGNTGRDRDTDARLEEAGWLVLRFWETRTRPRAPKPWSPPCQPLRLSWRGPVSTSSPSGASSGSSWSASEA